jgi:transglycosylase-like protein with SLT domain
VRNIQGEHSKPMRQALLAFCFTLSAVCIPASLDPAAGMSAAKLDDEKEPRASASGLPAKPDRMRPAAPADAGPAEADPARSPESSNSDRSAKRGDVSRSPDSSDASRPSAPAPGADAIAAPSHEEFCSLLMSAAEENLLPIGFFANLIWQESRFVRTAVSSAGALGVAQFMPAVAESVGLRNPFDPREALPASARLLRVLHTQFGNLGLAAAAYNAGPKRVLDWIAKRSRLPQETRNYVLSITGRPAEHWTASRPPPIQFPVPARVPCHRVASFSAVVQVADASPPRESVPTPRSRGAQEARVSRASLVRKTRLVQKVTARLKTAVRTARLKVQMAKRIGPAQGYAQRYAQVATLKANSKTAQR